MNVLKTDTEENKLWNKVIIFVLFMHKYSCSIIKLQLNPCSLTVPELCWLLPVIVSASLQILKASLAVASLTYCSSWWSGAVVGGFQRCWQWGWGFQGESGMDRAEAVAVGGDAAVSSLAAFHRSTPGAIGQHPEWTVQLAVWQKRVSSMSAKQDHLW